MRIFHWPWNITVLALLFFPLLIRLGIWQMDRGFEKKQIEKAVMQRQALPPIADQWLDSDGQNLVYRNVELSAVFWQPQQILFDNKIRNGKPGVEIIQLVNAQEKFFLVNRGWVEWSSRENLPGADYQQFTSLQGQLRPWPTSGIRLAEEPPLRGNVNLVTGLDKIKVEGWLNRELPSEVIYLDSSSPNALVTGWPFIGGTSVHKHYGYAVQWFAMALALFILILLVWVRKKDRNTS